MIDVRGSFRSDGALSSRQIYRRVGWRQILLEKNAPIHMYLCSKLHNLLSNVNMGESVSE